MVVRSGITILFQAPATLLRTSQVLGVDRLRGGLPDSSPLRPGPGPGAMSTFTGM